MKVPIYMPDLGLDNCSICQWLVQLGEHVYEGDRIIEILSGPVLYDVAAPATGIIIERHRLVGDAVSAAALLGWIEATEE